MALIRWLLLWLLVAFPAIAQTLTWSEVVAGQLSGHAPLPQCSQQTPPLAGTVTWGQVNAGQLCTTTAAPVTGPPPAGTVTWSQVYAGQLCAYESGSLCPGTSTQAVSIDRKSVV